MIKYYCDCCGQEAKSTTKINIPCHMWSKFSVGGGYQDSAGNQISGRMDSVDACNKCYNVVFSQVRKIILEMQSINYRTLEENKKPT